ncbi:MAG: DUF2845 domain-containing protein [Pseudomonas sp.]|nr:DUF2845 domain-containing protein [Pseudomonas sp.]
MKKILSAGLIVSLSVAFGAQAAGSFRLDSGRLISSGQSKSEVLVLAGEPLYQEVETIAVDQGGEGEPIKREVMTYKLNGSIGGEYVVVVTVENNEVVSVTSKQTDRM